MLQIGQYNKGVILDRLLTETSICLEMHMANLCFKYE